MLLRQLRHLSCSTTQKAIAVACPGQGIIPRGCLAAFKPHHDLIAPSLELVDEVLNEKFSKNLFGDTSADADEWSLRTSNAQPAILASTVITNQMFEKLHGIDMVKEPKVHYVLGHSLGEYTALVLAGVLDFGDALRIVRKRGLLMEELIGIGDYSMMVLVFRPGNFDAVSAVAAEYNVLACVNNSSQISISGTSLQVEKALAAMPEGAVLKSVKLPVKIPFHNELLESIESQLAEMAPKDLKQPIKPIVSNLAGSVSTGNCYLNTVKDNSKPVLWKQSLDFLKNNGIKHIVNLGPGSALGDMNKRSGLENHPLVGIEDMKVLAEKLDSL
ncbi:hypothetical_protein [Candidozyma auris]|uniref:hypothetical_protein n=1 Tax=Candidozyma auris TaxID=498019 RepID=UPI000D2A587B|nr:hypothetical_protein [[Candida] auris]QEO23022.1 hypothetical_protein [[Candida] auris]GBL49070.1 putative malonyl CoA-acyl carrier protein transacylase [[Candida] auris]